MSASRCLRCALDAARPAKVCSRTNLVAITDSSSKRISIQSKPLIQSRFYADRPSATSPRAAGSEIIDKTPRLQPKNEAVEQNKDATLERMIPHAQRKSASADAIANVETLSTDGVASPKPIPPNVVAAYRTPFRHDYKHGIPVASLQLRSFSVRNLEFFADFAMRVAYYLKLPASGPVPLPKRTERWTVLKSNFVHKKSQENFERITLRRLITVYDGHPEVVEIWLACLQKWQFYGVGMKANVFQFEGLDVATKMDRQAADIEKELDAKLANFGWHNSAAGKKSIEEMMRRQGGDVVGAPMSYIRDEIKDAKYIDLHRDIQ